MTRARRRVFIAGCQHETNTFSPIATSLDSFHDGLWLSPMHSPDHLRRIGEAAGYPALAARCADHGWDVVHGPAFFAMPSAPADGVTWQALRDAVLTDLERALPVDAVLLALHGAQMADGEPDCEGDLVAAVRARVGNRAFIGVLLDLHGHASDRLARDADALVACLEYPHTDVDLRAVQLADLARAVVDGGVAIETWLCRLPMIDLHHTTRAPMQDLLIRLRSMEGSDLPAISLMHGFPWADSPHAGAAVIVHARPGAAGAARAASELAERFFATRGEVSRHLVDLDEALDRTSHSGAGRIVIADTADNPGGGAGSDSTFALRRLIERRVADAGLAIVWDPETVTRACAAGSGARIPVAIGGHSGALAGKPLETMATVLHVADDVRQGGPFERAGRPQGGALLDVESVRVVVSGRRQQCVSPEAFGNMGQDPRRLRVMVVKSMQHFHAAFAPLAGTVLYARTPGSLTMDTASLPYLNVPRPIWPLDTVEPRAWSVAPVRRRPAVTS